MNWDALAAVAAMIAAAAATWQLYRLRSDALDARAAEIASVSVATLVKTRPTASEVRDGAADWVYEYTLTNPGRLPVSKVEAVIRFPCDVQRRHYDGSVDEAVRELRITAPMIPPLSSHQPRSRRLSIAESDWPTLAETTAQVSFDTPDAGSQVTHWPPAARQGSRSLRRRLQN